MNWFFFVQAEIYLKIKLTIFSNSYHY